MKRLFMMTTLVTSIGLAASGCTQEAASMEKLEGRPALAGAAEAVTGAVQVRGTARLSKELTFTISNNDDGSQITPFDESHTQQPHVIVVSSDLTQSVHEHV